MAEVLLAGCTAVHNSATACNVHFADCVSAVFCFLSVGARTEAVLWHYGFYAWRSDRLFLCSKI